MNYVTKRNERYYFIRRVPESVKEFDSRKVIRLALKTDSKITAVRKAAALNIQVEAYWDGLLNNQSAHSEARFKEAVQIANRFGFNYAPAKVVATLDIAEIVERVLSVKKGCEIQTEAVLGGLDETPIMLKDVLEKFWKFSSAKTINKTAYQVRKWRNPRIKAMTSFSDIVGNKIVKELTRHDILKFREYWIEKVKTKSRSPDTANKEFSYIKTIIETVSDNLKLELNTTHLFHKLMLDNRFKKKRPPLSTQQILSILQSEKLENFKNKECKWLIHVLAETGARPSEITGLLAGDIFLNEEIPYIYIKDRIEKPLKNANSDRKIPLTGYALIAFQNNPQGFPHYRDSDYFSTTANKFLRENDLLPSRQHSIYSFRHSFQDRILEVDAPDRVQADLMGHKFDRPDYGDGSTLKQKKEYMDKICLQKSMN